MITIDGSFGEGGGQVLRSSLALSMVTGQAFRIEKIRAGRKKPGLMRQHLTAVQAASRICNAEVTGDRIGSTQLTFKPGAVQAGTYDFSIGTAGSTTLVLQTVLLPLALAEQPSRITLEGGTHNPMAPPFDFLEKSYLPLVNRSGAHVHATLDRAGFFPAGGGRLVVEIEPVKRLNGFALLERGEMRERRATVLIANLPRHVAEREGHVVARRLGWDSSCVEIRELSQQPGPGNVVMIELCYQHVTEVFTGFGEIGRPAEAVAEFAVQQCRRYLKGTAPAGEFLTDQLMLPLALAGEGTFRSTGITPHASTHLELISQFLRVKANVERESSGEVIVRFGG